MCDYCAGDSSCANPTCATGGSTCACSLGGNARCPVCGDPCLDWYFGLGVVDGPDSVNDFLGGATSESGGFGGYPATKAQLVAAARQEMSDREEPRYEDVDWLAGHLPDGTYHDAGEVMSALTPTIAAPPLEGTEWIHDARVSAVAVGTQLIVPPDQVALLLGRGGDPLDVFGPGKHRLSRESAPRAAAASRAPAPGFSRSVLAVSIVFYSTRDQEGTVDFVGRSSSGMPLRLRASARYFVADAGKFSQSSVGRNRRTSPPTDGFLTKLLGPSLAPVVRDHDLESLAQNPGLVESVLRAGLDAAGLGVRVLKVEAPASPFDPSAVSMGANAGPFAHLPPEVRAVVQARMEEAMRHHGAAGAPTPPASVGPQAPKAGSSPAGPPGLRSCGACGAPNPSTGKFCRNCGKALAGPRTCPACGKEVPPPVKFCGECGHRMDA